MRDEERQALLDPEEKESVDLAPRYSELSGVHTASIRRPSSLSGDLPRGVKRRRPHRYSDEDQDVDDPQDFVATVLKNQWKVHPVFITKVLVLINIAFFIQVMYRAKWKFEPFSVNPSYGPSLNVLLDMGAKETQLMLQGEWWRFLTPMFLHSGLIHLLLNMLILYNVGSSLEEPFGISRVLVTYLISGIAGSLWSAIMLPTRLGVGSSGAIFGLVGSLFADFVMNHKEMVPRQRMCYFFSILVSTSCAFAFGLLPLIDNFAHISGFATGFCCGCILLLNEIRHPVSGKFIFRPKWGKALQSLALVGLVAIFTVGFCLFFLKVDVPKLCGSTCSYMDCIPTVYWNCDLEANAQECLLKKSDGTFELVDCQYVPGKS